MRGTAPAIIFQLHDQHPYCKVEKWGMWLNADLIIEEGKVYQGCSRSLDHPNSPPQLRGS